ncbi:MAG: hypothetical protein ACFE9L_14870 [Candidatus Hodarchaeota archaeon]
MPRNQCWDSERLQEIVQLMSEAKYDEVLDAIEYFSGKEEVGGEKQFSVNLLKGQILIKKGNFQEGLELAEKTLKETQRLETSLTEVDAFIIKAEALENLGKYDESIDIIQQGELLLENQTKL